MAHFSCTNLGYPSEVILAYILIIPIYILFKKNKIHAAIKARQHQEEPQYIADRVKHCSVKLHHFVSVFSQLTGRVLGHYL